MTPIRFPQTVRNALSGALVSAALVVAATSIGAAATAPRKTFASPEQASAALISAAKAKDEKAVVDILGPSMEEWISSGDAVQDAEAKERFVAAYDEKHSIGTESSGNAVLLIGPDEFPFPFPLVKGASGWSFDPELGKEEVLNRRIGKNELTTIDVLHAIVDAEREYASMDRDGDSVPEYAQKFRSSPGKKDGLYWEAKDGEPQSPLGPLLADAEIRTGDGPAPFHGYNYRILPAQGDKAAGGAYEYVVKGRMIGGFAIIATPVRYGISGFTTFIVNHDGDVYEADLGPGTEKAAAAIHAFNPDARWKKL